MWLPAGLGQKREESSQVYDAENTEGVVVPPPELSPLSGFPGSTGSSGSTVSSAVNTRVYSS